MNRLGVLSFFLAAATAALAQNIPSPGEIGAGETAPPPPAAPDDANTAPASAPAPKAAPSAVHAADPIAQAAMDHLIRVNQDLLDLLKKQQAVLEDIQYDRRLQNRQITLLEQRLEDTLQANAALQAKEARAEAAARNAPSSAGTSDATEPKAKGDAQAVADTPPPPPVSALPPEQGPGAPGALWWHRLLSLSGEDSRNSDVFHITGHQWRVLWHNQDRPGAAYRNTSALFINAFRKNDVVPKKICSQLGTNGDTTELTGEGDFYLKIEASGGKWELAVEDFH